MSPRILDDAGGREGRKGGARAGQRSPAHEARPAQAMSEGPPRPTVSTWAEHDSCRKIQSALATVDAALEL